MLFLGGSAGNVESVACVGEIVIPVCALPTENCAVWVGEGQGDFVLSVEKFCAEAPRIWAFALHVVGYGVGPAPDVA